MLEDKTDQLISALTERHLKNVSDRVSQSMRSFTNAIRPEFEEIIRQMLVDPLSGALNRHALLNDHSVALLQQLIEKGHGAVAMFDLDFFKKINDNYGHPVGDLALIHASEQAKKALDEKYDILYRYGGEEFVVISSDPDTQAFKDRMEHFRVQLSKRGIETSSAVVNVTTSIGIADLSEIHDFLKDIPENRIMSHVIEFADNALYHAKENGRNCIAEIKDEEFHIISDKDRTLNNLKIHEY